MEYNIVAFVLTIIIAQNYGLEMESITLSENRHFLKVGETDPPSVLQCNYKTTEPRVSIQSVTWFFDTNIAMTWTPSAQGVAGDSILSKNVELKRPDGDLELKEISLEQTGTFRCDVTLSNGRTYKSPEYHLLVVDIPNAPIKADIDVEDCVIELTWSAPAINPKPNPICGLYLSEKQQYISTAARWQATPYYNGSIAYRLENEKFEVHQVPVHSYLRCELGITVLSGRYIAIHVESHNITEVSERGCRPLEVDENAETEYENERRTCRNEIKPKRNGMPVKAKVQCKEGFAPKYDYLVTDIELECYDKKWEVVGDKTWNHFDNLICVEEEEDISIPPTRPKEEMGAKMASDTSSSPPSVLPWGILLLVVLTGGYALIARLHSNRKDVRYTA